MIGERVRLFRVLRKQTQGQLAQACGVRQGTICKIEKNRYTPSTDLLVRLGRALECEVGVLTAPPPLGRCRPLLWGAAGPHRGPCTVTGWGL